MQHMSTRIVGGPTLVTVEISLGELLTLQELLNEVQPITSDHLAAELILIGVEDLIEQVRTARASITEQE